MSFSIGAALPAALHADEKPDEQCGDQLAGGGLEQRASLQAWSVKLIREAAGREAVAFDQAPSDWTDRSVLPSPRVQRFAQPPFGRNHGEQDQEDWAACDCRPNECIADTARIFLSNAP
jgi:hypothetical protein